MTIVDKLVWDYHKASKEEKVKIEKQLSDNHFQISDAGDRYILKCINPVNQEIGYNADTFIVKSALELRFKNVK